MAAPILAPVAHKAFAKVIWRLDLTFQVRRALEAQGFQVLQTRSGNENPSFDDRSTLANAQRGAVFVSLHISSSGLPGTVRVYTMPDTFASVATGGVIGWDRAQAPYVTLSKKFGDAVQGQLAQRFKGSPGNAQSATIRQLRTTAAPAIAVELASVSVQDRADLDRMMPGVGRRDRAWSHGVSPLLRRARRAGSSPMNWRTWTLVALGVAVLGAAIYFPILRKRVKTTAKISEPSEEQARRELTQAITQSPSDTVVKAKMFWTSPEDESALAPATILSRFPKIRCCAPNRSSTLCLAGPVDSDLRTLPPDAALLAFYLLPDGTAIADFSEALATSTPSGIQSEQLAVDSIARTLEANVSSAKRLKILIHGQEMDTLAGHVDLTQLFIVDSKAARQNAISLEAPPRIAVAPVSSANSASINSAKR